MGYGEGSAEGEPEAGGTDGGDHAIVGIDNKGGHIRHLSYLGGLYGSSEGRADIHSPCLPAAGDCSG